MTTEQLTEKITDLMVPLLEDYPGYFLVEMKIKPVNNVKIFVDADSGVSIDRLSGLNRSLYRQIVASGIFPGDDFSLEVSSPGLDEPLKLFRQYTKNIGRKVEVMQTDGVQHTGTLIAATPDHISIEETAGKRKEKQQLIISFNQIKYTKVCVVFKM